MNKEGVLVIGSANMDLVVTAERFPQPGETIFGNNFKMYPGGKGANQAVSSAKLGGRTCFIGKFGDDQFCAQLMETMKHDGVNMDYALIDKNESTGMALITVNGEGQNEIIVISGSNMKLSPSSIENKQDIFGSFNVVLTQLEIPLGTVEKSAELAHKNGAVFMLNPAPAQHLSDGLLKYVDYLTPNEIELELISGVKIENENDVEKAARSLLKKGVKNLIVTMGSKGALLVSNNESVLFPANKVKAVDTTAAGDAFNGAVAYSLAKGKSINEAIKFANVAASISVTRMGAQSSMPVLEEIKSLIEID